MYSKSSDGFYRQNLHMAPPMFGQPNKINYIPLAKTTPMASNYTSQSPIRHRQMEKPFARDLSAAPPMKSVIVHHVYKPQPPQQTDQRYYSPNEGFGTADSKYKPPHSHANNNNNGNVISIAQQLLLHRLIQAQNSIQSLSPHKHTPGKDLLTKSIHEIQQQQQIHRQRSKSPFQSKPQKRQFEALEQVSASQSIKDQLFAIQYRKVAFKPDIFTNPQQFLKIGRMIGKGKFSKVHLTTDTRTGAHFAMKVMEKAKIRQYKIEEPIANEIKIQSLITHPNIIKLFYVYADDTYLFMLMELASDGDLYKYVKSQPSGFLPEQESSHIVHQVTLAIQELHLNSVIHRDIKPENIIRQFDTFKVADLGCAVHNPHGTRKTFCGTLDYVSPELATGTNYSFEIDLWALGILAFELVTGEPPFYDPNYQTRDKTLQQIVEGRITFPERCSPEFRDFVLRLLQRDPHVRMQIPQLLHHPWMIKNARSEKPQLFL